MTDRELKMASIRNALIDLFGEPSGLCRYKYVCAKLEEMNGDGKAAPGDPYERLDGKVFAICYPDNIYDGSEPTLHTLENVLSEHFPGIGGIHILPERTMSHSDLWPQDLLPFMSGDEAMDTVHQLQLEGILDERRCLTDAYGVERGKLSERHRAEVISVLDQVHNSHFNDGGFSQKTRAEVDPRFGTVKDVARLTETYEVMLDFVVNHLDVDNGALESYRRGDSAGDEFLIIPPEDYYRYAADGTLAKTFRPRPFPLFTGMRTFPPNDWPEGPVAEMNRRLTDAGLEALDEEIIRFLSIAFKIANDQGLTAEDTRIFKAFVHYLNDRGIDTEKLFSDSTIQPQHMVFSRDVVAVMDAIGIPGRAVDVFDTYDDEVFGRKFFVYTTFSESQADVNPVSEAGFRMVIDDLFNLLDSGSPAMLRMDAIKYLWKEIGKRNFDMPEGNTLIGVIRTVMAIAAPAALPLDEINSPDPVVYEMIKDGGFAYVFGQVNAVPAAFNSGTLAPIVKFRAMMDRNMPEGFVSFVMLSTHDGRSVQGLGVDRTDGHVSIRQFYDLMNIVVGRGGKPKYRSVPKRQISADTFAKCSLEAALGENVTGLLFEPVSPEGTLFLRDEIVDRQSFLNELSSASGTTDEALAGMPPIDFVLQWLFDGLTPYELCCTSRDAFTSTRADGTAISPQLEAKRLALAQLYVLTLGQGVPAVYFNDLLGIGNDFDGYEVSGRPRDLNRRKVPLHDSGLQGTDDPFAANYVPLINRYIDLRSRERAFYPGSNNFEFVPLSDTVFCNHAYARDEHAYVVGNISDQPVSVELACDGSLYDLLSGGRYDPIDEGTLALTFGPYEALWLKPVLS